MSDTKKATRAPKTKAETVKPAKTEAAAKPAAKAKKVNGTAILQINNVQYVAKVGQTFPVMIELDTEKEADLDVKTLAIINGTDSQFGSPFLDTKVDFTLVKDVVKGEKVYANKFKAKSRYRKKVGHRAKYLQFTLNSLN